MNDSNIYIKEKRKDLLAKGSIFLALMVISLICTFAPLLISSVKEKATSFYIIGGFCFAVFTAMFVYLLFKEFKPNDLFIINSRGFIDNKNVGPGILIEWTNVASVKVLGKKEMPFLGITLENSDIVIAEMKRREADEMRENIDENLPHILVAQNEVYTPIKELKDIFVKLIKEARILSNAASAKTKSNPFTTEDVLRAFGQLPIEETETNVDVEEDNQEQDAPFPEIHNENVVAEEIADNENSNDSTSCDTDSFYDRLQQSYSALIVDMSDNKDEASTEQTESFPLPESNVASEEEPEIEGIRDESPKENNYFSTENDDLTNEINEFLSKAKFTKISELEKILNDTDVPFILSRDNINSDENHIEESAIEDNAIEEYSIEEYSADDSLAEDNLTEESAAEETQDGEFFQNDSSDNQLLTDTDPTITIYPSVDEIELSSEEDCEVENYSNDFKIEFPANLYSDITKESPNVSFESLIRESKTLDLAQSTSSKTDKPTDKIHDEKTDTKVFLSDN